jgi:hypothetical protein
MSLWPQVYRGSMSIKGEQQARLTALHVRLRALESVSVTKNDHSIAPS